MGNVIGNYHCFISMLAASGVRYVEWEGRDGTKRVSIAAAQGPCNLGLEGTVAVFSFCQDGALDCVEVTEEIPQAEALRLVG